MTTPAEDLKLFMENKAGELYGGGWTYKDMKLINTFNDAFEVVPLPGHSKPSPAGFALRPIPDAQENN